MILKCYDEYSNKEKFKLTLVSNPIELLVDAWLVSEVKKLDEAGVEIVLCIYDYDNHLKIILIKKSSHDLAWRLGYVPVRHSVSGDIESMSYCYIR